jgi:hypothetical protein
MRLNHAPHGGIRESGRGRGAVITFCAISGAVRFRCAESQNGRREQSHGFRDNVDGMSDWRNSIAERQTWWTAILRDVQFWVPLAVLLIGLVLLWLVQ